MSKLKKAVLVGAGALFLLWISFHFDLLVRTQSGAVRFVLGLIFSGMILLRKKKEAVSFDKAASLVPILGIAGALLVLIGIIFGVKQFEWLGLVMILGGCLLWVLPASYAPDTLLSLLLLYWIHPLPSRIFMGFQGMMQRWSVLGAEWLLHAFNNRVWADGMVLRTGFRVFDVPVACSGMTTAVAVMMCALAIGLLFRFRWHHLIIFVVVGVLQVLLLNILRISMMVVLTPKKPVSWSEAYLHDSMGIFLIGAVFLLVLEAMLVQAISNAKKRRAREQRGAQGEKTLPRDEIPAMRTMARIAKISLPVLLIAGLVTVALYRRRPHHRGMMIAGVVDGLMMTDPAAADRASAEAVVLLPGDTDLRTSRVRLLTKRGKFELALKELEHIPGTAESPSGWILKALVLLGADKPEEAAAILTKLPDHVLGHPDVVLLRAELAARHGDVAVAARNVELAASLGGDVDRIRGLFPSLARAEQWDVISRSDPHVPHKNAVLVSLILRAHVETGKMSSAAILLEEALEKWPDELGFLGYVSMMAVAAPGGKWEERFVERAASLANKLDKEKLALCVDTALRLERDDLATSLAERLRILDPNDPALLLSAAEFGDEDKKRVNLDRCLDVLDRRSEQGTMDERLMLIYTRALKLKGDRAGAHEKLAEAAKRYPNMAARTRRGRAALYEERGEWDKAYEMLWVGEQAATSPVLSEHLLKARALLNLNTAAYAFEFASQARASAPQSSDVSFIMADIWHGLGNKEEALFALEKDRRYLATRIVPELLAGTGRLTEAKHARRVMGIGGLDRKVTKNPTIMVPQAEWAVRGKWPPPLAQDQMVLIGAELARGSEQLSSPYFKALVRLKATWFSSGGVKGKIEGWEAVGRDDLEKGMALYEYALLTARWGQKNASIASAQKALEYCPCSPFIWRLMIILSDGDNDVIRKAYASCPDDAEVWLAMLVTELQEKPTDGTLDKDLLRDIDKSRFSVGTMVRAGDLLMRKGLKQEATTVAKSAVERAHGFIPAYLLGLKCALATGDREWASACAMDAAALAEDPAPYYEIIVRLRLDNRGPDAIMSTAIEYLMSVSPRSTALKVRLAETHLANGDATRAFKLLAPVVNNGTKETGVAAFVVAAEAARRLNRFDEAAAVLGKARELFPSNKVILNNLVYCLSFNRKSFAKAEALLPELLKVWGSSFAALDTAAMVYRNKGDFEKAAEYLQRARVAREQTNSGWLELNPRAMEIEMYRGAADELLDRGVDPFESWKQGKKREKLVPLVSEILTDTPE